MPPMEPNSEQYGFVPQTPFTNSAISATAPVISEDTLSSPEATGMEPVPIFTSGLVCPSLDSTSFSSSTGPVFDHICFPSSQSFDIQCGDTRTPGRYDLPQQTKINQISHLPSAETRSESRPTCTSNQVPSSSSCYTGQLEGFDKENAFSSACLRRQHAMNIPSIRYRPNGSSSSIGSRSSSNSPGINRRYSNTSRGRSSMSTDEDMSTNPNTPNTPVTPLTPSDARGDANKDVTIFSFPETPSCNATSCSIDTGTLPCECEGLELDLDLDADDDVFCTDLRAISSTITSLPLNMNAALESCTAVSANQDINSHHNLNNCNINNNLNSFSTKSNSTTATANATTTSTNLSSLSPFPNCHLHHRHQNDIKTDINSQVCDTKATINDPLPALLSDALQVCEREEEHQQLGETRDTNNNHSCSTNITKPEGNLLSAPSSSVESSPTNPALLSAAVEAYQSGQMTPLLKHELKWVIQLRRLSQGKDEMEVSFDPPSVGQMSDAEMTRAERRRKQNRIAARKFRQKRKSNEEQLVQTIQSLKETNSCLEQKAEQLRNEKQALMEFMADHLRVCPFLSQLQLESLAIGDDTAASSS